jgi:hypothetical protein
MLLILTLVLGPQRCCEYIVKAKFQQIDWIWMQRLARLPCGADHLWNVKCSESCASLLRTLVTRAVRGR